MTMFSARRVKRQKDSRGWGADWESGYQHLVIVTVKLDLVQLTLSGNAEKALFEVCIPYTSLGMHPCRQRIHGAKGTIEEMSRTDVAAPTTVFCEKECQTHS